MNESTNNPNSISLWKETFITGITQLDSKTLLLITGMFCTTSLLCVGLICFSGGQITVGKGGISIIHSDISC